MSLGELDLEEILKRYPEIGDCPKKVLSNPPQSSLEALKRFDRTPFWAPETFKRAPVRGTSEAQRRFYRTFRIEPPLLGYSFKTPPEEGEA